VPPLRHFHPLLLACFPVASVYGSSADRVPAGELWLPLGAAGALGAGAWGVARLLLGDGERGAPAASAAVVAFWAAAPLAGVLPGPAAGSGGAKLAASAAVLGLAVLALAWALRRTRRSLGPANRGLTAAALVLVGLAGSEAGWNLLQSRGVAGAGAPGAAGPGSAATAAGAEDPAAKRRSAEAPSAGSAGAPPLYDIYWIVLDAHGRSDILESRYGVASDLSDGLRELGFTVAERSAANYSTTIHSVASALNYNYVQTLAPRARPSQRSTAPLVRLIRHSRMMHVLRRRGYEFVAYASGFGATHMPTADRLVAPPQPLGEMQLALLNLTPLPRLIPSRLGLSPYDLHRRRVLSALERLPEHADDPGPTFVMMHLLSPHHPFVFGPEGEDVSRRDRPFRWNDGGVGGREAEPGEVHADYLEGYAGQVRFLASRVRDAVAELLRRSEGRAVILVQGDHGPNATWPHVDPTERLPILNAYYLPDGGTEDLYPEISPVNSFRLVLRHYLDVPIRLLDDRHYLAYYDEPFRFEPVPAKALDGGANASSSGSAPSTPSGASN